MIYHYTGFLLLTQAAKQLNITRQAIYKAIKENRIDGYKCGCIWMVKYEDLDKFKSNRIRK